MKGLHLALGLMSGVSVCSDVEAAPSEEQLRADAAFTQCDRELRQIGSDILLIQSEIAELVGGGDTHRLPSIEDISQCDTSLQSGDFREFKSCIESATKYEGGQDAYNIELRKKANGQPQKLRYYMKYGQGIKAEVKATRECQRIINTELRPKLSRWQKAVALMRKK